MAISTTQLDADMAWMLSDIPRPETVTLQSPTVTVDVNGEQSRAWAAMGAAQTALIVALTDAELDVRQGLDRALAHFQLVTDMVAGFDTSCRVVWGTRTMNVVDVMEEVPTGQALVATIAELV